MFTEFLQIFCKFFIIIPAEWYFVDRKRIYRGLHIFADRPYLSLSLHIQTVTFL